MEYIKTLLKQLMDLPGLSGFEGPVSSVISKEWDQYTDEVTETKTGSVHGLRKATDAKGRRPHTLMIATHMDAIGMMVTSIDGGCLHFTDVGGIDPRILPGTPVLVHATGSASGPQDLAGVIAAPHPKAMPPGTNGTFPMAELLIDIGLSDEEARSVVQIGDIISFNTHPMEHGADMLSGHSADNRASVVALSQFLRSNRKNSFDWDIVAVATSQEETTFAGAYTSSRIINPDLAIVIDVTFARGPGSSDWRSFPAGKGITLGLGPNIHTGFMRKAKHLAEQHEIPVTIEPMPKHSGTDAYAVQVANHGIPTIVIGIPLKYMHTPVEMINLNEIKRAAKLLTAIAEALDEQFLKEISWDKDEHDDAADN